jgi:hypothetical protein
MLRGASRLQMAGGSEGGSGVAGCPAGTYRSMEVSRRTVGQNSLQIDEVNINGDYVLDQGAPWTAKTGDQVYGTRDELAIDGDSLGDDFGEDAVPLKIADSIAAGWKVKFCSAHRLLGAICSQRLLVNRRKSSVLDR